MLVALACSGVSTLIAPEQLIAYFGHQLNFIYVDDRWQWRWQQQTNLPESYLHVNALVWRIFFPEVFHVKIHVYSFFFQLCHFYCTIEFKRDLVTLSVSDYICSGVLACLQRV